MFSTLLFAQKEITLEDIWAKGTFRPEYVWGINWMNDGAYYSSPEQTENGVNIIKNSIKSGQKVGVIVNGDELKLNEKSEPIQFDGYEFNADETKILFTTETEGIYRRSSKSVYYLYDVKSKKLSKLSNGKQMFATYSPDAKKIAFVRDNNLFFVDLESNKEIQVSKNGKRNEIINGWCDWVYEEEFGFAKAFFWSPDGSKIAFYEFNESEVPEYNMQMWGDLYPEDYRFKYPKAGENNSIVNIKIYDVKTGKTTNIDLGGNKDQYIPRIKWTNTSEKLLVYKMNRLQNRLDILQINTNITNKSATSTSTSNSNIVNVILSERDDAYVEIFDDVHFMEDGFIMASEKDGFKHLYYYNWEGKLNNQITTGDFDVVELKGVDEKNKVVYYTSAEAAPMRRDLYRINLDGTKKSIITKGMGTHEIDMSPDTKYFIDTYSNINTPPSINIYEGYSGKLVRQLKDNHGLKSTMKDFQFSDAEFFKFKTSENVELNGYMIKPKEFSENKKYPVLMHVYGGPGINTVNDEWLGSNYTWYQMLAQKDYIIVSIDGRGTGYRGAEFKKCTYGQLGKLEAKDQIEGAKYLKTLPYIDENRVGIWGWSFGGYMTSLCMTIGKDAFKMGIAVAPVTTWRYYDTIYTERYLGLPQDNVSGYDDNSPIQHAEKLSGKYLLIHGTGDDNVHFQNAVDFQNALIKANKQFDSFYYPNRNHGIYGGNTRLHLYNMMTNYILENL